MESETTKKLFEGVLEDELPEFADGRTNDYTHLGALLPTRNGRATGNATVVDVEIHRQAVAITVITDAGNIINRMTLAEIERLFYPPTWFSNGYNWLSAVTERYEEYRAEKDNQPVRLNETKAMEIRKLVEDGGPHVERKSYIHHLPIPEGVYWSVSAANFYRTSGGGMGNEFYNEWRERVKEFPQGL